jgi:hypothetical protein
VDTAFLKLTDGPRLSNYVGLDMETGFNYKHGKNYLYVEIPVLGVYDTETDKFVTEVKRNQHVFVRAACSVDVSGRSFIEVEPNPALAESGIVQSLFRVHPESGCQPVGFWFSPRKDTDLSKLTYAVRIYMPT